jgi:hypothetical protein
MSSACLDESLVSFTLIKMSTKNMNTKAIRLRAETGKIAPTALVTKPNKGGKEIIVIREITDTSQISA